MFVATKAATAGMETPSTKIHDHGCKLNCIAFEKNASIRLTYIAKTYELPEKAAAEPTVAMRTAAENFMLFDFLLS